MGDTKVAVLEKSDDEAQLAAEAADYMRHLASRWRDDGDGGGPALSLDIPAADEPCAQATPARVSHVTLEWRGLRYAVLVGKRRHKASKTILEGLSAAVPPGRLLAIMGPTGCGKSSLVNALAGRLPAGGTLEGEILINGLPRGRGFRSITAYVMQDDVLFHNLTVHETLEFAARMRLPASVGAEAKEARVNSIIAELGLSKARDTRIGNAFVRGVSGGERKRANIAVELLSCPSLLFLDEPTSGLDAFQAQNVMEALWSLARGGRSVVATIHQPRSSIFSLFDLLCILSEGRAAYFGPAEEAVSWFASLGFPCPAHYNPADFFADVVAADHRSPEAEAASRRRISLLVERFRQRQEEEEHRAQAAAAVSPEDQAAMQQINERPAFPNSLPVEFALLLRRAWKQQSRDRLPQVITFMQTLVLGFVLAVLFSDIPQTEQGVRDELGVLFMACMFNAMAALFASLNTFPQEAGIVNRERSGKSYHVSPYYLARFICDMPMRVGQGVLFGVIVYWIVGLNPSAGAFFIFVALTILEALASQALGVAVSAACPSEKVAFAAAPGITIILMLFGGFFVSTDSIPAAIRWITYLSHLYYAFMGLTVNNFRGRTGWSCQPPSPDCTITGDEILARLGFEDKGMWEPFTGLACLAVGYNLLGYAVLRFSKQKFLPLANGSAASKGTKKKCLRWIA